MPANRSLICLFALSLFACGDAKIGPDAGLGVCSDGIDNDGDGKIDFPADVGCENESDTSEENTAPQCSDHRDNDEDGKTDFPEDPGCVAPNVDDEVDDCPSGPNCPQCSDGKDNDFNGITDYPADTGGCTSAADAVEFTDDALACGAGLTIQPMPIGGVATGMLMGSMSSVTSPCGGGNNLPAVAYVLHVAAPKVIVASTDGAGTAIDTVLDLRSSMCSAETAEVACHDDIAPGTTSTANKKSKVVASVQPGTYYLIVTGKTASDTGAYSLEVDFLQGEGTSCAATSDCGPGLVCRTPLGGTEMVCSKPMCSDGVDDDGDGENDYPTDPGCTSPTDNDEADVCTATPLDPMCPQCANGVDDNNDGNTDYPNDPHCHSAATSSETCVESDEVGVIDQAVTNGTTIGAVNDFKPSCASSTHNAPEVVYRLDVPNMATLNLEVSGFDMATSLLPASCGKPEIACSDPNLMTRTNVPAGTYFVVVDGWSTASGAFTLTTSGKVAAGGSCEGQLFQAGVFTCADGYTCGGTVGSRTCVPVACADGADNDGDGKADYPNDPGCMTPGDMDESGDDCFPTVGPNCPACSDGIDNDSDGATDFPADIACPSSLGINELCNQTEPIMVATTQVTSGTTVGATNDFKPTCGSSSTHSAPDVAVQVDIPQMDKLAIVLSPTGSWDSAHALLNSTCGGTAISCFDSPTGMNNMTDVARGRYYVIVDGYSTGNGAFTLNISGTIHAGESCESPLAQSGALTCGPGYACQGTPGARTCAPTACNDGIDNDGDAKADYPADPGCTSKLDLDEADDCFPTPGPNCPQCADGVDNDGDTHTDHPADTSCFAPSEDSEACTHSEALLVARTAQTTGTTVGAVNDTRPPTGSFHGHGCSTTSATATSPDVTVQLDVPAMEKISLTLSPVSYDSTHFLLNSTCGGTPVECYDSPTGMVIPNLAGGRYYLVIDGYSTASGTFTLNVSGTIKPGESCESELAQSGAISCGTGYTCSGTPGSRRCIGMATCSDGMDNDGDAKTDYPFDPGCSSPFDSDEADDCFPTVGPNCPQCGNGIDDDADQFADYGVDPQCPSASFFKENFCLADNVTDIQAPISMPLTTGTLAMAGNELAPSCQASTGNDVTYPLTLPVPVTRLQLDTFGSVGDTVLSFWDSQCTIEIACDDDGGLMLKSLIVRNNVPAGDYLIEVDSAAGAANNTTFMLNVRGTVAPGTACTDPLFTTGVLACPTGTACTAGTCQ